ncbi:hypothetical protein Adt_14849 [Abeliophyllum distichum]|uniref:U5 small nuclear ribonucleoprotein TSSC4 n=1 Tax=Abeliophyllum distichum TaxID=126358 RepID=A0ABD1U0T9_9LAMI
MEDSFTVRVDKVFGSLGNTASSVSVNPSLWRLTDDEIKRQEWNRNKEEDEDEDGESEPSDYPSLNQDDSGPQPNNPETDVGETDLQELSDFEEEDEINGETKNHSTNTVDDEVWDVQSLIGRDCTLDYEEEEDEYDKVAVCREVAGDRLYMKDVKVADYGFDRLNTYGELPNTFHDVVRDPRANHMAAKLRLKEDAEAAGNIDSLQFAGNSVVQDVETEDLNQVEVDGYNPKSILKKRGSHIESHIDSKTEKRVRFRLNSECSTQNHEEQQASGASDLVSEPCSRDDVAAPQEASDLLEYSSGVPDYMKNPSKYTRYTFDSSEDMDEQSNQKAYMDLFHQLRKGNTENSLQDDTCSDIPKLVVFTPKKKPEDDFMVKTRNESLGDNSKKGLPLGVAEEDAQDSEVSAMEEDEPYIAIDKGSSSLQKPGRQYRSRTSTYADDTLT